MYWRDALERVGLVLVSAFIVLAGAGVCALLDTGITESNQIAIRLFQCAVLSVSAGAAVLIHVI